MLAAHSKGLRSERDRHCQSEVKANSKNVAIGKSNDNYCLKKSVSDCRKGTVRYSELLSQKSPVTQSVSKASGSFLIASNMLTYVMKVRYCFTKQLEKLHCEDCIPQRNNDVRQRRQWLVRNVEPEQTCPIYYHINILKVIRTFSAS